MARPPIPIDPPDFNPEKSRWIRQKLAKGFDCGVKSPFRIPLYIPSEAFAFSHKTEFFNLQNIDGARIGLKYYPNKNARIAVRIESDRYERMGVKVAVYVPSNARKPTHFIEEYGRRKRSRRSLLAKKEYFNFGTDIMDAREFANDERNRNGVEIVVIGYVFVWDERKFKDRENWKFAAGVTGYFDRWGSQCHEEIYGINQELEGPDYSIVAGNLDILAKNSQVFKRIQRRCLGDPAPINVKYTRDVNEIGIKLCYDHRLVERMSYEQKLDLLLFFDQFKVSDYKEQLEQHLIEYIDYATVGDIAQAAHDGHSEILRKRCIYFIRKCLRDESFFLGSLNDSVGLMIIEAANLNLWHEWHVPIFYRVEEGN